MNTHLFHKLFAAKAAEAPDRTALSAAGTEITYGLLADRVWRRAKSLRDGGLGPGDRVALLQDRTLDLCTNILACLVARLSVTVLSRRESTGEAAGKLRGIGCAKLITDSANSTRAREIAELADVPLAYDGSIPAACGLWMEDEPRPGDEAVLIFTSGSSGPPKAVIIEHGNLSSNTAGLVALTPVNEEDHFLHVMPLSHTNGICNQLVLPLAMGARVTLLPRFSPEDVLEAMVNLEPTVVTGVPTMFQRLLRFDIPVEATRGLRMLRCGSAPLARETHEQIEAHLGCEVLVSYGQTELTCTSTANPPRARKPGSVGVPIKGTEMAILSADDVPLAPGETGEVCFRGPNLARGYVGQDSFDRKSWFRTGDSGYVDADGYLFLTGRLKEIILRGGENLSPGKIEEILLQQPGIMAACVVPAPDDDLGEVPFAFIETTNRPPTLAAMNQALSEALSPAHRLSGCTVVDDLPVNRVGKVDRKELTRRAAIRHAA